MFWGFVLILLGILMVAERMGIIYGGVWDYFWPIILIAIGASMIFNRITKPPKH